ncbi:MAG: HEAT repeat domain-containing protein [Syntrophomonas sp.]
MPDHSEIIQGLQSEDERDRAFAVEDIVFDGISGGLDLLIEQIQREKSVFVREVIVNNIPQIQDPALVQKLLPLLRSDDAFIRNAIIDIVSTRRDEVAAYLEPLMEDADKDVRKFALDILYQLNTEEVAPYMVCFLKDSDINIIITAVEYLGNLGAAGQTPAINTVLEKAENLLLRCTCLEALAKIGDDRSREIVGRLFPNPDAVKGLELFSYLKYMAKQGNADTLPFILSLMTSKGKLLTKEIINTLQGILERTSDGQLTDEMLAQILGFIGSDINSINKYELLVFLGQFKNQAILDALLSYSESEDRLLVLGAIEGLGLLGRPEALPVLQGRLAGVQDEDIQDAIQKSLQQVSR